MQIAAQFLEAGAQVLHSTKEGHAQIAARFLEAGAQVVHKYSPFCQRGTREDSSSLLEAGA